MTINYKVSVFTLEHGKFWVAKQSDDRMPTSKWCKLHKPLSRRVFATNMTKEKANRLVYLLVIHNINLHGAANVRGGGFSQVDVIPMPKEQYLAGTMEWINEVSELTNEPKEVSMEETIESFIKQLEQKKEMSVKDKWLALEAIKINLEEMEPEPDTDYLIELVTITQIDWIRGRHND